MNITKQITTVTTMAVFGAVYALHAEVVNITQGSTTGYELTDGNTYVIQNSVSFSNSTAGGSGMSVADGATVVIYIPKDVTLTAIGAHGSGQIGGGAGIRVPETSMLVITGEGRVNAAGGNAGNGGNGSNGENGVASYDTGYKVGAGGAGGAGGGGGGSGIGGVGGIGGSGGDRCDNTTAGNRGKNGSDAESMGTVYVVGSAKVSAIAGDCGLWGSKGSKGSLTGVCYEDDGTMTFLGAGGGGGGGGAGSSPSSPIWGGGAAGGGGGSGGKGSQDYHVHSNSGCYGCGGSGGGSLTKAGEDADPNPYGAHVAGGTAGSQGGGGMLYVSPTAIVDVEREKLVATTHSAAQYVITFDANGGLFVSSLDSLTATLGCELPDCIPAPTKNGFAFDGWKSATGEEYYGAAGTKTISSYPVAGDVVLYAQWKAVGHTSTTPVPVPYSYFDENCPTLLSAHGGDYEAVALSAAMNGCDKVWECYVSGISPTNKDSRFTAIIKMGADGKPILSWKPPLNGETTDGAGVREGVRRYCVYGKRALDDVAEEWKIVHAGGEGNYRFFKVLVGMPESK